ncbi:hypothetical protein SGFS_064700 [Streptomyces graminofaciens]|uniref:DUF397 domain-containing protein n=1 Tax=Streptomyces graminofaciens TaxID=68212 RepID=A0ABM7FFZ7_9ACTN|nr:DUF397 domain-containing protein [Streptomyces graminofaciens]BBC35176.1 hypothetical protein SGFS_064700 [Streptomyces graminofaciens]
MADGITWQKSSFSSGGEAANCLEVAAPEAGRALLRESDDPATVIAPTPTGLAALIRHLSR